jgi:hypothetical protein
MPESLESLNESFCGAGGIELIEVIVAQFSVVPISSDLYRIWQEVQRAAAADSSGMT